MHRLCPAADLAEACLLQEVLGREGVKSFLLNVHAQGALGEIPFGQAGPELWLEVPADAGRAREIVDRFRRARPPEDIPCPACGDANPATFDWCWRCRADVLRPGA